MSDDDQPTYVPLIKALVRKPAYTPPWVRPYPGSGKSAYLKTAHLRALYARHITRRTPRDDQKWLTPETLDAIAAAIANLGIEQVTPFRRYLPPGRPSTVRDSFGRVQNRPGKEPTNLSIGKLSRGKTTFRPSNS